MPANEAIPFKSPGDTVTARCSAAVTGKRFVAISGDRTGGGGGGAEGSVTVGVGLSTDVENVYKVATAGAGVAAFGVAAWDGASGGEIKVFVARNGIFLPITAGEALTAGWEVESNAEGKAVKYTEGVGKHAIGMVLTKAELNKDAEILFY